MRLVVMCLGASTARMIRAPLVAAVVAVVVAGGGWSAVGVLQCAAGLTLHFTQLMCDLNPVHHQQNQ